MLHIKSLISLETISYLLTCLYEEHEVSTQSHDAIGLLKDHAGHSLRRFPYASSVRDLRKIKMISSSTRLPLVSFHRLLSFLLLLQIFHTAAAQISTALGETSTKELSARRPPVPSLQDVRRSINPGQPTENRAWYWTSMKVDIMGFLKMDYWADGYDLLNVYGLGVWENADYHYQENYQGTSEQMETFKEDLFRVFGENTKGKMYLIMPYDRAPTTDSYFWRIEWPEIRDRGQVTEIVWIDGGIVLRGGKLPNPYTVTKVWWRRGDPEPRALPAGASSARLIRSSQKTTQLATRTTYPSTESEMGTVDQPMTTYSTRSRVESLSTVATSRRGGIRGGFFNPAPKSRLRTSHTPTLSTKVPTTSRPAAFALGFLNPSKQLQ